MNQHICSNCRRAKLPAADGSLPQGRYCFDCNAHRCPDFAAGIALCGEPQGFAAGYLGFCPKHWRERYVCPTHKCGGPKEPWMPLCPRCEERVQEAERRARVKRWRVEGRLCPRCRQAPQRAPQGYCKACLIAQGLPVLEPVARKWLGFVRSLRKPRKGEPLSLAFLEARERAQRVAKLRARATRLQRKRLDRLKRQAKITDL